MIYNDCRDCELYKGNCGHHFIDGYNHINYNFPTESRMDDVIGSHGSCFVPSEQYKLETKKEVVEEITKKYSIEMIRMALKEIESEPQERENKCKKCEYYNNPDYTRCHECENGKER